MLACHAGGPGSIPGRCNIFFQLPNHLWEKNWKNILEAPGIDPGTSRMLSERSTIWATPPVLVWSSPSSRVYQTLFWHLSSKVNIQWNMKDSGYDCHCLHRTFDSSVGRAVDCSCSASEIHRSLVQIRLEGFFEKFQLESNSDISTSAGSRLSYIYSSIV